ncbi:MAG: carbohydrate kinase family protein [Rhodanobacteraceae bacterium]
MNTVYSFGEALIDFHGIADGPAPVFTAHPGGAPANVAVATARLGGRAAFVGMLGRDIFGDLLLHELSSAGVDTQYTRRTDAAHTALAFVAHTTQGERSFSFYRPPAADLLFTPSDFDAATFAPGSIFHAGSCSMSEPAAAAATLYGMSQAHAVGALVSFDMNLRSALWPHGEDPAPTIWRALALADCVKLSAEELAFLAASAGSESDAFARLWTGAAQLVLVTDRDRPIRWLTPTTHGAYPAFAARAVDTTGAGDAFIAGCLYGLARAGIEPRSLSAFAASSERVGRLLRFAAACGALAVMRAGSFSAMPTLAEVEALLETQAA